MSSTRRPSVYRAGPKVKDISGTVEDPATGSANAALAALLLHLDGGAQVAFDVVQGVEMGRPSRLAAAAWRAEDGVRARVGGGAVRVLEGVLRLL